MGRSTRRGPWLPEEDGTLLQLVHAQGPNNWVRISQHMEHRSPKQCRERYHQNLKPNLNHEPISPDEGEVIEQLVQDMGKRWAEIARRLGNRSDNAVKNWWNGSMNRRKRHHGASGVILRAVGPRALPMPLSSPSQRETAFSTRLNLETGPRPTYGAHPKFKTTDYETEGHFEKDALTHPLPSLASLPRFDQESHQGSISLQQPYLPRPEFREMRPVFQPASAPTTAQNTPDPFSLRSLHPPPNQYRRHRPNLESQHSCPSDWQPRPHGLEPSSLSPAATDFSNVPPVHQVPSLIPDNQSHCSISPKTVSSPRPSLPAPIDTSTTRFWNADRQRNSYMLDATEKTFYTHDEGYFSAAPPSTITESSNSQFSLDPLLKESHSHHETNSPVEFRVQGSTASSPTERDSRMNVSRLLLG